MTRSAAMPRLGSEFDEFLFAPIGEDKHGMLLSVLSALARLDIDPWLEAAQLAGLPAATATERLASLIGTLPAEPATDRDPGTIAARLIALLPRPATMADSGAPPRQTVFGIGAAPNTRSVIPLIAINLVFMVFLLGAQWIMASHQPSPPAADADAPAITGTVSAPTPPSPGQ